VVIVGTLAVLVFGQKIYDFYKYLIKYLKHAWPFIFIKRKKGFIIFFFLVDMKYDCMNSLLLNYDF